MRTSNRHFLRLYVPDRANGEWGDATFRCLTVLDEMTMLFVLQSALTSSKNTVQFNYV